ncbi:MAG: hypothetical protein LBG58_06990, partial [Planctomycetaceae bacterium]|nr:hypothetical protein [Planctomycetaceae bacterium]
MSGILCLFAIYLYNDIKINLAYGVEFFITFQGVTKMNQEEKAILTIGDKTIELPVLVGTEGHKA